MSKVSDSQQFIYGHWEDGKKFIAQVKPPIATVRPGHRHLVVEIHEGPKAGESYAVPNHWLPKGTAHAIWKWFVAAGLIGTMILIFVH